MPDVFCPTNLKLLPSGVILNTTVLPFSTATLGSKSEIPFTRKIFCPSFKEISLELNSVPIACKFSAFVRIAVNAPARSN